MVGNTRTINGVSSETVEESTVKRPEEFQVPLLRRRAVAEDTLELLFDFSKHPLKFTAGQYLSLIAHPDLALDPPTDQRDFSIASPPMQRTKAAVAYRDSDSPVKRWLRHLPLGSLVSLRGPAGSFKFPEGDAPVAMVAGGVGMTPFRSMLTDPVNANRQIGLLCWNSTPERVAYAKDLGRLTGGRELILEIGAFDPKPLAKWHDARPDSHWLVSGPSEMVWNVLTALEKLGVPKDRVRTEEFTGYEDRPDG